MSRIKPRPEPQFAIADRSSSIRKLQRQRHLPQPTEKAQKRHRERRRDIQRAENMRRMVQGL